MFDSIAGDYDALNHILSLDVDKIWRRRALKRIVDAPAPVRVLDLACGTGDFSIAIAKALSGPLSLSKRLDSEEAAFRQARMERMKVDITSHGACQSDRRFSGW